MNDKCQKIVLFGAGNVAQCVASYFSKDDRYDIIGCCVDGNYKCENEIISTIYDYSVLSEEVEKNEVEIVVCIGYSNLNHNRQNIISRVQNDGWKIGKFGKRNSRRNSRGLVFKHGRRSYC